MTALHYDTNLATHRGNIQLAEVFVIIFHKPLNRMVKTKDYPQQCRLPASGTTDNGNKFIGFDFHIYVSKNQWGIGSVAEADSCQSECTL